ncbi:MAG: Uma2 family endonuclease [Anaerolineaceae bacterium]|nr:Uma2 family endonuclease [Anaerolineaceae bacterium]
MAVAEHNLKFADRTIISKYADITMDAFVALVEANPDTHFKCNAAGDVIVMSPKYIHADVHSIIAMHFNSWLLTGALPGHGAPIDCLFELEGWRSRPDLAVHPRLGNAIPREAPRMAVEIRSDSNTWRELRAKAARYLQHGTQMVWLVDTDARSVEVHRADEEVAVFSETDLIEGGDVLPGFQVAVSELFPD